MIKNIPIQELIDERNIKFIDLIHKNNILIDITRDNLNGFPYWTMVYDSHSSIVKIWAGKKTNDKNAFTHELLHVIEEINGQPSHQTLYTYVQVSNSSFATIFNQVLINHINNVILHERMIVDFLNAGFPKNKFVYDYYKNYKLNTTEKKLFNLTCNNKVNGYRLEVLLNLFFSFRFHPNSYIKKYYEYKLINKYKYYHSDLINDLISLCSSWTNKTIQYSTDFFTALLNTLDNWATRNNYSY